MMRWPSFFVRPMEKSDNFKGSDSFSVPVRVNNRLRQNTHSQEYFYYLLYVSGRGSSQTHRLFTHTPTSGFTVRQQRQHESLERTAILPLRDPFGPLSASFCPFVGRPPIVKHLQGQIRFPVGIHRITVREERKICVFDGQSSRSRPCLHGSQNILPRTKVLFSKARYVAAAAAARHPGIQHQQQQHLEEFCRSKILEVRAFVFIRVRLSMAECKSDASPELFVLFSHASVRLLPACDLGSLPLLSNNQPLRTTRHRSMRIIQCSVSGSW